MDINFDLLCWAKSVPSLPFEAPSVDVIIFIAQCCMRIADVIDNDNDIDVLFNQSTNAMFERLETYIG